MPADIGELQDAAKSRREKLMAMRAKVTKSPANYPLIIVPEKRGSRRFDRRASPEAAKLQTT